MYLSLSFFFTKQSTNADDHKYVHALTRMNACIHIVPLGAPLKDRVQKTDPTGTEIDEVPHAPRYRWKCRLSLKNISPFMRHKNI
jgi:hypothetical protein